MNKPLSVKVMEICNTAIFLSKEERQDLKDASEQLKQLEDAPRVISAGVYDVNRRHNGTQWMLRRIPKTGFTKW